MKIELHTLQPQHIRFIDPTLVSALGNFAHQLWAAVQWQPNIFSLMGGQVFLSVVP